MSLDDRRWRRAVWWGLLTLVILAATLMAFNVTAIPHELARRAARLVSDETGWTVEVGSARFAGPTRLLIEDVKVSGPEGMTGSAPRTYVAFDPLSLLGIGRSEFDWGRVDLVAPHFVLPEGFIDAWLSKAAGSSKGEERQAPSGGAAEAKQTNHTIELTVTRGTVEERRASGPAALWRAEGAFHVRLGGAPSIRARRIELAHRTDNVTISARGKGANLDELEWTASGPADLALSLVGEAPWRITGAMTASGILDVGGAYGELAVEIAGGDFRWSGLDPDDAVAFDSLRLEIEHSGNEYSVKRIEISKGDATLTGEGVVRPQPAGDAGVAPELEITVAARGLSLPADIPRVSALGLSGRAEFTGVIAGSLADPEVSGRLRISEGTVWRRPVDRGEGVILLKRGLFRFGKTELIRGEAKYELHGEWMGDPARTSIELAATKGDIREMLLAAGTDIDVAGSVDGSFSIVVDEKGPQVKGEGEARGVRAFAQPFDSVAGRFTWSPGYSRLDGVKLRLGEGSGTVSGEIVNGMLNVAVEAERWPAPRELAFQADGWLSFSGSVNGSTVDPMVHGTVRNGYLQFGRWTITGPYGDVVVTRELVHLTRLRGKGAGDGVYELNGDVSGWMDEPAFDLDVAVENASLSGILDQGGFKLPARLFDGKVSGTIALEGSAGRPRANFDLLLADEVGIGDPMRLRFQVNDGKVKLGQVGDLFGRGS